MYGVYLHGKLNYSRMVLTILKKWLDYGIDLEKLRSRAIVRFYLVFLNSALFLRGGRKNIKTYRLLSDYEIADHLKNRNFR